jgi:N-acetylmuramoyl-L-alanine amidase
MTSDATRTESPRSTGRRRALRAAGTATVGVVAVAACALPPQPPPSAPPARPETAHSPRLPPVPAVDGPLELRVSYPRDSLFLATRQETFIFGSAGSRRARVWVGGEEVEVQPNGGFLAFLPVPEDSVYRVRATLDGETQTVEVPVSLPPAVPDPGDSTLIVAGSVYPSGARVALPGEAIEVGFTGTAGGEAWLELDSGRRIPLAATSRTVGGATEFEVSPGARAAPEAATGLAVYEGMFSARPTAASDPGVRSPTLAGVVDDGPATGPDRTTTAGGPSVVLALRGDTVRQPLPVNLAVMDPTRPRVGVAEDPGPPERNGDGRVPARPGPGGGPYHYLWPNGTELELTGEWAGAYRVRLADGLHAWVPVSQVRIRPAGTPPPRSSVRTVRLDPAPEHIDVHIALERRLPYRVDEDDRSLSVLVYGATSRVNFLQHGRVDPYIERAEWSQPADDVFRVELRLTARPWGFETFWGEGNDLVLRLKRPPPIIAEAPFQGLTIGLDPGHGGADSLTLGPTGLKEADANLWVGLALRAELERRGARVVMSRTTDQTLSLVERTRLARAADVDVWISVHNNALPDGIDPWENNGASVYYNHARAAGLAWSIQRALLDELGVRDLGIGRADLHQPRFTWAPAILTESLFMMIPEQEAFLRTDDGQRRVARAHVRGLEAWLRTAARGP